MNKPSLASALLFAIAGAAHAHTRNPHVVEALKATQLGTWAPTYDGSGLAGLVGGSRPGANNQRKRRKKARIFRSHNRKAQRGRCR